MAGRSVGFHALVGVAALALAACTTLASTPQESIADASFRAIYEAEWAWRTSLGPREDQEDVTDAEKTDASWPRVDPKTQETRLSYLKDVLAKLDRLDPASLSVTARENLAIYRYQIETRVSQITFREYEKPLNADTAFWTAPADSAPKSFRTEEDARIYIARLKDLPRYFADQTTNMRAGLKRGFTPPRVTLEGRDASISSAIDGKTAESSLFFAPFKEMPASIPTATRDALQKQALAVISDQVFPAYRDLRAFYRTEYMPGARVELAATRLPDGEAYYRSLIKEFTTLDMSPDQIHQLGLAEMAKIRARMDQTIREAKFDGDFDAFLKFLRTDPQFYPKSADELLKTAAWVAKKFDGKASRWFGRLPRSRFAIVPVAPDIAPFYTAGRGGAGSYLVNTYNLPSRSLYAMPALTLHESAPGHAFQIPLASEQKGQPEFRRTAYISAYGEGWALYCELLGEEMGIYETPYDKFGMLSYQAWRAARLVVDTGIHAKGWTREQAQAYLKANTALPEHEITTEVDRYISWPGQALSYYLGEMTILDLRQKAEKELGAKFDVRYFHDAVLQTGSVPMDVLKARINRFIADGGQNPYPAD